MSWSCRLALASTLLAGFALADDSALWKEYGLVQTQTAKEGKLKVTSYRMKDVTGALAAWEWLRSPQGRGCDLATFCTIDSGRTVLADDNYVLVYEGAVPTKEAVTARLAVLPNKRDTSLPAILTFMPKSGLVPDSARYILGEASLAAFAPELSSSRPGFEEGAEAQVATYEIRKADAPVRIAIFYYATPEMARLHSVKFRQLLGSHVKRSGVLVAAVLGSATDEQADTILSRIQYEAKITWNETPPPSPIKPLYQLLVNILYLSAVLTGICLTAGLIYAGMRIYRRRYGDLESEEAMTTLHLTD